MPMLSSGRHVAVEMHSLAERIRYGEDHLVYGLILMYRLSVSQPTDLYPTLPVVYFRDGEGTPPDAPRYRSGYTVAQVLAGEADWSAEEIAEFRTWLETDPRFLAWLHQTFAENETAIRESIALDGDIQDEEDEPGVRH